MRFRQLAPLLAAGAVILVALVAAFAGPLRVGEPVIAFDQLGFEPDWFQEDEEDENDQEWWERYQGASPLSIGALIATLLFWVTGLVVAFLALRALIRYLVGLQLQSWRRSTEGDLSVQISDALQEAVELAAFEAESALPGQASDAVVTCWVLLEDAAARVGTPRVAPQTPTEFTVALLAEHQADRRAVDTLLRLYHQARFSPTPLPDRAAGDAGRALRAISASLSAARARGDRTRP